MQLSKEREPAVTTESFEDIPTGSNEDICAERSSGKATVCSNDFPDGGMRAWLVVFGVCPILISFHEFIRYHMTFCQAVCGLFAT